MANTKEQREKLIKARQERLARDAKKQGITPEQLLKKKRDTYLNVVGGAALGALPFGAILRGASALFKGMGTAAKASKVGKKVADTAKKLKTSKTPTKTEKLTDITNVPQSKLKKVLTDFAVKKSIDKKTAIKQLKDAGVKKPESNFTKIKKLVVATTGKGGEKGRRSGLAIRDKKTGRLSGISKKTQRQGKVIRDTAKVGGPLIVAAGTTSQLMKKKDGSAQAMPKSRPSSIKPKTKKDFGMGRMDDFGQGRKKGSPEGGTAPIKPKKKTPPKSAPKMEDMPKKKSKNITAGGNVGFGPKGNIFPTNAAERKKLMDKYGGTGSAAAKAAAQGKQGSLKKVGRT